MDFSYCHSIPPCDCLPRSPISICTCIQIARNVFELGMRYFDQDPGFILEYVAYLEHINDDKNLRSLFERVLHAKGSAQASLGPIWRCFLNFELTMSADGGQLDAIEGVERRMKPSSRLPGFERVAHRYSFRGLCPDSPDDAQYLLRIRSTNQNAPNALTRATRGSGRAIRGIHPPRSC